MLKVITKKYFFSFCHLSFNAVIDLRNWIYTSIVEIIRHELLMSNDTYDKTHEKLLDKDYLRDNIDLDIDNCLVKIISLLPEKHQTVMRLSEIKNKSDFEITMKLKINDRTVIYRIDIGRQKIKELFYDGCLYMKNDKLVFHD